MASEKEANLARQQNSDFLRSLGAHAIAVDEIKYKGKRTFAVVAYFVEKPVDAPETLKVRSGKTALEVPLATRLMERFKPE